jgi:outer membrane receptor protein involved in Fe transport
MITFDGELRYQPLANTTLRVGAQNIFNRKPPFTYAYAEGYDYETHDPRGQFLYLGITQHF